MEHLRRSIIREMDEHLFLKGQRVITPEGEGEVVDAIGDKIVVKLDNGHTQNFSSDDLEDNKAQAKKSIKK